MPPVPDNFSSLLVSGGGDGVGVDDVATFASFSGSAVGKLLGAR